MKRSYLFKNIGGVCLAVALLVSTLLTSCKDNSPGSINFSKSPALVGFQYTGFNAVPVPIKVHALPAQVGYIEVTLSVASLTLSSPVTVNIGVDNAGFEAYNTNVDPNSHLLPTADYTVPSSITIEPGQQIVKLKVTFAGNIIDFTQDYVLAFKITSVSGGAIIASNLNAIICPIVLQSVYEGEYVNTGSFNDVTNSSLNGSVYPEDIDLLTQTALSVAYYDLTYNFGYGHAIEGGDSYYGSFDPVFTFSSSNANATITGVTNYYGQNSGSHVRSAVLDPTGVNAASGTPGTSGFKIQVKYIMTQAGTPRTYFNETYTYVGPAQ